VESLSSGKFIKWKVYQVESRKVKDESFGESKVLIRQA